ncbi:MAG: hypothetical protein C0631_10240 [Sedimenticola sp.]|nr:MAG: hypothetical protein C0631_10240 [Sedimenticola sp.]
MIVTPIRPHEDGLPGNTRWLTGLVVDIKHGVFLVRDENDYHVYEAVQAFSCLVQPEQGDVVCMLSDSSNHCYISTILERNSSDQGDNCPATNIKLPGKLNIEAKDGLSLHTSHAIEMRADVLNADVSEVNWLSKLLRVTGQKLLVTTGVSRLTSKLTELLTERMQMNAERSYRNITEAEHIRAGVFDVKAEQIANIRGRCAVLSGKELVKVAASQVHIG